MRDVWNWKTVRFINETTFRKLQRWKTDIACTLFILYCLHVVVYRVSSTEWQVPGVKYRVSSTGCQVPGVKYRVASTGWQVPGVKYRVSSTEWQVPSGKYRVSSTERQVPGVKYRVSSTGWQVVRILMFFRGTFGNSIKLLLCILRGIGWRAICHLGDMRKTNSAREAYINSPELFLIFQLIFQRPFFGNAKRSHMDQSWWKSSSLYLIYTACFACIMPSIHYEWLD